MASFSFSVEYESRVLKVSKAAATLLQSILEDACKYFKVDSTKYKLTLVKEAKTKSSSSSSSPTLTQLDHSLPLRLLGLKHGSQLILSSLSSHASTQVHVTLELPQYSVSATLLANVQWSLWTLLSHIERADKLIGQSKVIPEKIQADLQSSPPSEHTAESSLSPVEHHLCNFWGIPPVEKQAWGELHITREGYLLPLVEIAGANTKKIETAQELAKTTLFSLGFQSESKEPKKIKLKVNFKYIPNEISDQDKAKIIADFSEKFTKATAEMEGMIANIPDAAQADISPPLSITQPAVDLPTTLPDIEIPSNRGNRVFMALPGQVPKIEVPDEFYEFNEEDSLRFAHSLREEAVRLNPSLRLQSPAYNAAHTNPVSKPFRKATDYKCCLIRFKLPYHLYVEAIFRPSETTQDLYHFLDSLVRPEIKNNYYVYITPPRQILSSTSTSSLLSLRLLPQALVYVGLSEAILPNFPVIKDDVLTAQGEEAKQYSAQFFPPSIASQVQLILPQIPLGAQPNESESKQSNNQSASAESDITEEKKSDS